MIKFCSLNRKYKPKTFHFPLSLFPPCPCPSHSLACRSLGLFMFARTYALSLSPYVYICHLPFAHRRRHLWCWYVKTIASACINFHLHKMIKFRTLMCAFVSFVIFLSLLMNAPIKIITILGILSAFHFPSVVSRLCMAVWGCTLCVCFFT